MGRESDVLRRRVCKGGDVPQQEQRGGRGIFTRLHCLRLFSCPITRARQQLQSFRFRGSLRPPRSQRSIPSERNMRGSINSEGSIGHSKRIGQRDAKVERRTLRSDRHSHRSGGRSLSSGEQSQRSTSRRGVPAEQIPQI